MKTATCEHCGYRIVTRNESTYWIHLTGPMATKNKCYEGVEDGPSATPREGAG